MLCLITADDKLKQRSTKHASANGQHKEATHAEKTG